MREFVTGTDEQYRMLKESLEDRRCHVYRCNLPPTFNVPRCRIGFEKEDATNGYALFIDKGLTCRIRGFPLFSDWLREGTLRFMDFNDVKVFLKRLSFIYGG